MKKDKYNKTDYVFVICAYKESPYLEECICSLVNQTLNVKIVMVTSTPSEYLEKLSDKYKIEYHINYASSGIANDWNYGIMKSGGKVVTIAHQDDVYEPKFAETVLNSINKQDKPLIAFTDYGEIRKNKRITNNRLLNVKRVMLLPLRSGKLQNSIFTRRRILSFGSPICCPSVTYIVDNLPSMIFEPGYKGGIDWQAWERISRLKGAFVYCKDVLMYHRIHADSETTAIIADNNRTKEDYAMFRLFWPTPIAKLLMKFYVKGQDSNNI